MKILYVSRLCSDDKIERLFDKSIKKPALQAQKFHSLFTKGIVGNNVSVHALSSIPVTKRSHKKLWWSSEVETDKKGICFEYLPFINIPVIKHLFLFAAGFFKTYKWCKANKDDNKFIICDTLDLTISISSYFAAKLCKCFDAAIVTDIPSYMEYERVGKNVLSKFVSSIYTKLTCYFMRRYDGYVLLTEYMNNVVNPKNKPNIVVEGLVDIEIKNFDNKTVDKYKEKIVIYAGALYEKYGVKKLISAFSSLSLDDARLWIYGTGEMEKEIMQYEQRDKRIKYFGMIPNSQVVIEEMKAALLVNPRPSSEEFTKYSFPSKNMEYMASGTPVLTTPLGGMPKEYYEHVYIINDESVNGIAQALDSILKKPADELCEKGANAKDFVLRYKNNIIQVKKVLNYFEDYINVF